MSKYIIRILLGVAVLSGTYSIFILNKKASNNPKEKIVYKFHPTPKAKVYFPDNAKVELYCDYLDISYSIAWACYMAEQGVDGYTHGQRRISGEIVALFSEEDRQLAQSVRTLSNARREFIKLYPDAYAQFKGRDSKFLELYVTKFIAYLANTGWNPEGDKRAWAKNVLFFYKKYKKEGIPVQRPKTIVIR